MYISLHKYQKLSYPSMLDKKSYTNPLVISHLASITKLLEYSSRDGQGYLYRYLSGESVFFNKIHPAYPL